MITNKENYKDYRVNIKVKNNRILKAIEQVGGVHGLKWCKENGLNYIALNDLTNMTASPVNKFNELTTTAKKLCEVLDKLPEDLWSDNQIIPLEKNFTSFEMSSEQLVALMSSGETSYLTDFESEIDKERLSIEMESSLNKLSVTCRKVLKDRFYEDKTLEQMAKEMGVTKERVRQIEQKALRMLRHPKRHENLNDFIDARLGERVTEYTGSIM
jgi:RNA polymerase sigma factor (sigma-70 family)